MAQNKLTAIDLFAGAGGSTEGLKRAGFKVLGAVENNKWAIQTYKANHPSVKLWQDDILQVSPADMRTDLGLQTGELTLLLACPPCQSWSTLGSGDPDDPRNDLIEAVWPFVREFEPRCVILENVPGLSHDRRFRRFVRRLREQGYGVRPLIVNAIDFGVPQNRRRLVTLAVRGMSGRKLPGCLPMESGKSRPKPSRVVFSRIERLRESGVADEIDVSRNLKDETVARVSAIPVGGSRSDLPEALQLECHKKLETGASSPYGRIRLSEPGPTMTTRCTSPSCGRFVHPTEHRGLTLREAALFQTFPPNYEFKGTYGAIEAQIGNAVPVLMAKQLGRATLTILDPDFIACRA